MVDVDTIVVGVVVVVVIVVVIQTVVGAVVGAVVTVVVLVVFVPAPVVVAGAVVAGVVAEGVDVVDVGGTVVVMTVVPPEPRDAALSAVVELADCDESLVLVPPPPPPPHPPTVIVAIRNTIKTILFIFFSFSASGSTGDESPQICKIHSLQKPCQHLKRNNGSNLKSRVLFGISRIQTGYHRARPIETTPLLAGSSIGVIGQKDVFELASRQSR